MSEKLRTGGIHKPVLHSSEPIEGASEDLLGRASFVAALGEMLIGAVGRSSSVVALNGRWGSGKTSVANLLLEHLSRRPKDDLEIVTVQFNPWWFSGRGDLLIQFLEQLQERIEKGGRSAKLRSAAARLSGYIARLRHLSVIPEPKVQVVGALGQIAEIVSSALARARRKDSPDIYDLRDQISRTFQEANARVIVIVDDIDRLSTQEIRDVFQFVRSVGDFANVSYLLLYDRLVVADALKSAIPGDPIEFIQKIVQFELDLPAASKEVIRRIFFERVEANVARCGIVDDNEVSRLRRIYWAGIDDLIGTFRHVNQVTNRFEILYPPVAAEVNAGDFLALQTIAVYAPALYRYLSENRDLITGARMEGEVLPTSYQEPDAAILRQHIPAQVKSVERLLIELFPKCANALDPDRWLQRYQDFETYLTERRICVPSLFDIYFRFEVDALEVSNSSVMLAVSSDMESSGFSTWILESSRDALGNFSYSRCASMLDRLAHQAESSLPAERIPVVLEAIYKAGDELIRMEESDCGEERRSLFDRGIELQMWGSVHRLLMRYGDQESRSDLLVSLLQDVDCLTSLTEHTLLFGQEHGRHGESNPPFESERTITAEAVESLEHLSEQRLRRAMACRKLEDYPRLGHLLFRVALWISPEAAQQYAGELVGDDQGLVRFLSGFVQRRTLISMDRTEGSQALTINEKSLREFYTGDLDKLRERARQIVLDSPTWLTGINRRVLEVFIGQ